MTPFASSIIAWQKGHGRHDLPWQNTYEPYAIWVSEIMLQQTQVASVIIYYQRFMQRFPSIEVLARATQDEVLQYWSGLGYYARARNLHNAAQKIIDDFDGIIPQNFEAMMHLPGIGRSTAAAISTFAFNQPQPILDGNVKRVFARHFLVEGWTSAPKVERQLWQIAHHQNPSEDAIAYTQGLMDLGATLCSRSKPKCVACPVNTSCEALAQQREHQLPTPKPRKVIPEKSTTMLVMLNGDAVLLEKRPPMGIWGGLWSLPEATSEDDVTQSCHHRFGVKIGGVNSCQPLNHTFTHFKLKITPQIITVLEVLPEIKGAGKVWLPLQEAIGAALPTPVRKILLSLLQSN